MLTTTFLLATAVATAAVLGLLLLVRKPDGQQPVHLAAGAGVLALAAALAGLGLWGL